jgi:ubiquinone/menaquinone biosynthesis C-methylase UbiE
LASSPSQNYILGHSEEEVQRLIFISQYYRPFTERVFREAGVGAGMRVLDVGCGAGDVSILAAEMVGKTGFVVGLDQASVVVKIAARRAGELGISNVEFVCTALDALEVHQPFDAAVGRNFLIHQNDPRAVLRQVATKVRDGGLIVFQEHDFTLRVASTWPPVPLLETCFQWITEAHDRSGIQLDLGKKLHQVFRAAGLLAPEMCLERLIGSKHCRAYAWFCAAMVRTLSPKLEAFGIASREEIKIDTLAERLERELVGQDAVIIGAPMIGAWSHKS